MSTTNRFKTSGFFENAEHSSIDGMTVSARAVPLALKARMVINGSRQIGFIARTFRESTNVVAGASAGYYYESTASREVSILVAPQKRLPRQLRNAAGDTRLTLTFRSGLAPKRRRQIAHSQGQGGYRGSGSFAVPRHPIGCFLSWRSSAPQAVVVPLARGNADRTPENRYGPRTRITSASSRH